MNIWKTMYCHKLFLKSPSIWWIKLIQYAQRILARNHSGPTSVKSRKCWRNFKKKSVLTPRNAQEKSNTVLSVIYYKTLPKHRHFFKLYFLLYLHHAFIYYYLFYYYLSHRKRNENKKTLFTCIRTGVKQLFKV